MSYRTPSALAVALLLAGTSTPALAQEQSSPSEAPRNRAATGGGSEDMLDEEIVVTGQKLPGSVVGDIPPEQVLTPADVRAYGVSSISDLLTQLSPQTGSARGRGGEAPVVLLNGRRISSFMEIRDLPTEAIQRVEVLPEEVALKYGFTADQKVVNFVLRQRFRSKTIEASGGQSTDGGAAGGTLEAGTVAIQRDNRFNLTGRLQGSDRLLESQRDLTSVASDGTDLSSYRTLRPRSRTASLNGVFARPIGKAVSAAFNGMLQLTDSDGLAGLPTANLLLPAASPFGSATTATTVNRTLSTDALTSHSSSVTGHLGAGFNGTVTTWRWNLTGNYDHVESKNRNETGVDSTTLQARLTALDPSVNPRGTVSQYLGATLLNRARSNSDTGNVQFVTNGKLAQLPAGALSTTIKVGGTFTSLDSRSERVGVVTATSLARQTANGQINIDLPIAKRNGTLGALGNLTANANLAVNQISDFGTQRTYGFGVNWSPTAPVSLIASYTNDEGVPSIQQLGNPVLFNAQARVFDYRRGQSVDVTAISGGNPNLRSDNREVIKLGGTWKPFTKTDLTFNANYVHSVIRDAVASLPEPTSDIEAAFPDRFLRDASGTLIRIDTRPVNFSRERTQTLRWGFNLSIPLKPSQAAIDAFRAAARARFGNMFPGGPGGSGGPGAPGAPGGPGGDQPPPPPPGSEMPGQPGGGAGSSAASSGGGTASNGLGSGSGNAGGGGGGGFGGPGGGGPGGGFGPPGGFGAGARQRFQQNAGGRLQITVFHTWLLQDDILIRPGVPLIDLLDGGAVGSGGGATRHQIDAQLGYSNNGIGARISETWKSGSRVNAGVGSTTGDLRFSDLATTDIRLFANVGQLPQFIGKEWARNLRVTFAVTNVFNQRQSVRDAFGSTPLRYQGPYQDPVGRAFTIGIRKLFSPLPAPGQFRRN